MDIGIFSINTEYTVPADELARECEAWGFESLWLPEHTHMPAVIGDFHSMYSTIVESALHAAPEGGFQYGKYFPTCQRRWRTSATGHAQPAETQTPFRSPFVVPTRPT